MTKYMLATLVLGLTNVSAPAMSAQWLKPCAAASFIEPPSTQTAHSEPSEPNFVSVPPNRLGCTRGVARRVDAVTTIWRCQVELADGVEFTEGQPEYGFLIQTANRPLQELPDELMAGAFNNFDVINVNLNQGSAREHILAAWNGQSNGMGVHLWTIFVFDANWNLAERFEDVADWGSSNLVAAPGNTAECDLAITRFERGANESDALILHARLYQGAPPAARITVPDLGLEAASDRPHLARRYTRAFERQRTAWFSRGQGPGQGQGQGQAQVQAQWQWRGDVAAWLNNSATKPHPFQP